MSESETIFYFSLKTYYCNLEYRLPTRLCLYLINNNIFHSSFVVSAEKSIFHTVRTYNVVQYYKFERKYDLQYPHLPCVRAGSKELAIPIEVSQNTCLLRV